MWISLAWLARLTDVSTCGIAMYTKSERLVIVGHVLVSDGTKKDVWPEPFEEKFISAYFSHYKDGAEPECYFAP